MKNAKRFVVNDNCKIIDTLDLSKRPSIFHSPGDPEDDIHLRERVLWSRLSDLVDDLLPNRKNTDSERFSQTFVRRSMWWTLCTVICASRLNGMDVAVSVNKRFSGIHKREKTGLLDETSISLFVDDVECLLRDLYGNVEMESVLLAVRTVVKEYTQYARPDLWHEFSNAECYDLAVETGLPHVYYGASSSQREGGEKALLNLMNRSRAVLEAKSGFSEYTIKFATYCDNNFDTLSEAIDKRLAVYEAIEKRVAV